MKRTFISLGVTLMVAVIIWFGLDIVAPDIYVEKAFVWIIYPSIAAGLVTALAWRPRQRAD